MGDIEYSIVKLMNHEGISQAELSRRTGISTSSLSRYLSGEDMPASKLRRIADALGVSTDALLGIDFQLDPDERVLVDVYRSLCERDKRRLLEIARTLQEG